jgi:hypothetical protein
VLPGLDGIQVEQFKQATEEKLRGVRCPEHRRPPRIRFHGNCLREITISLSGCCPKVMELANARIGGSGIKDDGSGQSSSAAQPKNGRLRKN